MTVRYVRVKPLADFFAPVTRAYGNVGIVGTVTAPTSNPPADILQTNVPVAFTDPAEAVRRAPGALGTSIRLAFEQTPGPSVVYGVRVASTSPDHGAALQALSAVDVQIVVVADTGLTSTTGADTGAIGALAAHVVALSGATGGDGKERIGVAMLTKGSADPTVVSNKLVQDRMVYVAHKSDEDAAAAVAGTIAGHEPHISLLLKKVNISSDPFTPGEIRQINGDEAFETGPAKRNGVNWLAHPTLIPGRGVYLGEAYTGDPNAKPYIDVVRSLDSISFALKAQLIRAIGNLRISRSGLRALIAQMEAVLDPLVAREIIDDYEVVIPLLALLDKDPDTLTPAETEAVQKARTERRVEVLALVTYAAAVHRLSITLKFE